MCSRTDDPTMHDAAPLPSIYRIIGPRDPLDGEPLYWSNTDGWVSRDTADIYATRDGNLPDGGRWVDTLDDLSILDAKKEPA